MALVSVVLSGLFGIFVMLVALIGFDVSLSFAFALYLVSSVVPVALVMAGLYLHLQVIRPMAAHKGQVQHARH